MTSAVYTPTASQWASAATHLENHSEWRYLWINGVRYVSLVSGRSNRVYLARADAGGCGCIFYTQTGRQCSHMLAIELAVMEDELRAETVVPLKSYRDIFPGCAAGCGELVERQSETCYACVSNETRRLDQAARRQAVGA